MSVVYRAGYWTDVSVLPDGRFAQVTTDGAVERIYFSGQDYPHEYEAPEDLMFCRCATVGTFVFSIHQGHDSGKAWLSWPEGFKDLGLTFGVQPVAIDGTYAYVVRSPQSYDRIRLDTGAVEHLPHGVPGSSQGIRDVVDGRMVWADDTHVSAFGGITLHDYNERGAVRVGQADPPQIAAVTNTSVNGGRPFTAIPGDAFEPHLAQSGDRYAIVARTPQGAAYVEVPPYPALVTAPVPVPVPQPVPAPEPKPSMSVPNRSAELAAFWQSWNGKQPITDDAKKHEFTAAFMAYLNEHDGSGRWGRKSRVGNAPVSKDTAAYWLAASVPTTPTDGKIHAFDLISGGTGAVNWDHKAENGDPGYANIDARWYPVTAVSAPPAPAQPPASDDLAALRNEVAALSVKLALAEGRLEQERADRIAVCGAIQTFANSAHQRLDALEQRKYKATGTTSRDFGHSHRITVTLEPQA